MEKSQKLRCALRVLPRLDKLVGQGFEPNIGVPMNKRLSSILRVINNEPNKELAYYAKAVGLETGSFTYAADCLEQNGLVERIPLESDKRKKTLQVTTKGEEAILKLTEQLDAHFKQKFSKLTDEELEKFFEALDYLSYVEDKIH